MTTTTTTTGMPGWVQPYAQGYLQRAQQVADTPYQQYQGPTVAGFSSWQQQGLDAMANRAMQGSPVLAQAQGALSGMMGQGGPQAAVNQAGFAQAGPANPYLGMSNPYLSQQIDAAQGDLARAWNTVQAPQFDTAMSRSGSFGNEGIRQATTFAASDLQRNMARIAGDMRMQDYGLQTQLQERGIDREMQRRQFNSSLGEQMAGRQDSMANNNQSRVLAALGLAPSMAAADYGDIDRLMQAGSAYQQQDQRQLTDAYQRFVESRDFPQRQLDIMGGALGRSYGQTSTQQGPGPNRLAQGLGGALTFAQLYDMMFGGE